MCPAPSQGDAKGSIELPVPCSFTADSAQVHPRHAAQHLNAIIVTIGHHQVAFGMKRNSAQPPNSWCGNRMPAACLSATVTAHVLRKHINLTASVTTRLKISKLCRCSPPKCEPNACFCAAVTWTIYGR